MGNSRVDLPLRSNQTHRILSSKTFAQLPAISTFPVYTFLLSAQTGGQHGQLLAVLSPDKTVIHRFSAKQWDAELCPGFRPVPPRSFPVIQVPTRARLSSKSVRFVFHKNDRHNTSFMPSALIPILVRFTAIRGFGHPPTELCRLNRSFAAVKNANT